METLTAPDRFALIRQLPWGWCCVWVVALFVIFLMAVWISRDHNRLYQMWRLFRDLKKTKGKGKVPVINIQNKPPGHRWIELGCGANPNPNCDVHTDVRHIPGVTHFTVDLDKGLPEVGDADFEGVLSVFAFEHVSWRNTQHLIRECYRILRPGGRIVVVVPNTEAQLEWIRRNPEGWDGKDFFESASEKLYGSEDYAANTHKSYWNPVIAQKLFQEAGFENIVTTPFGARNTDMVVDARKPTGTIIKNDPGYEGDKKAVEWLGQLAGNKPEPTDPITAAMMTSEGRASLFTKEYFHGGAKWGGYGSLGYFDFPAHETVFRKVMFKQPKSVLEIGAARGHVVKRFVDIGVPSLGLDISQNCRLTRATKELKLWDLCNTPWPAGDKEWDVCLSVSVLEHIPEQHLPAIMGEMARTCHRGIHGIGFLAGDDKTRVTIKGKDWWGAMFAKHAPGWPVEVSDKNEMEAGPLPLEVTNGDGKVKVALGTYTVMSHFGWNNVDIHDLGQFAQQFNYRFIRHDLKAGIPFTTGVVDLIHSSHMVEHLTYSEAASLFKDMRRAIKVDGTVRVAVPDARQLVGLYYDPEHYDGSEIGKLSELGEMNDACALAKHDAVKLHSILCDQHHSLWDAKTLCGFLEEAGFKATAVRFREAVSEGGKQILRETLDMFPEISCFVEAVVPHSG